MIDYREYTVSFCHDHNYPEEATASMVAALDRLTAAGDDGAFFFTALTKYASGRMPVWDVLYEQIKAFAEKGEVSRYTYALEFWICASLHLHTRYKYLGLSDEIFYDSMEDLRAKLFECKAVKGVWGSFVSFWFPGFFEPARFALGRLQFEHILLGRDFVTPTGRRLSRGDSVINIHIPSGRPLTPESVADAYSRACEFFAPIFRSGEVIFRCSSWLLHPSAYAAYPEGSNTRAFISDFTLIPESIHDGGMELWRIFDSAAEDGRPMSELPEDSSLRRRMKAHLLAGGKTGGAEGIQIRKNGILTD